MATVDGHAERHGAPRLHAHGHVERLVPPDGRRIAFVATDSTAVRVIAVPSTAERNDRAFSHAAFGGTGLSDPGELGLTPEGLECGARFSRGPIRGA